MRGTLGGAVACNLGGRAASNRRGARPCTRLSRRERPRRAVQGGGRVVKNVTGFDLSKLIAGSFGTLAALTELTVRALPAPEETRTV